MRGFVFGNDRSTRENSVRALRSQSSGVGEVTVCGNFRQLRDALLTRSSESEPDIVVLTHQKIENSLGIFRQFETIAKFTSQRGLRSLLKGVVFLIHSHSEGDMRKIGEFQSRAGRPWMNIFPLTYNEITDAEALGKLIERRLEYRDTDDYSPKDRGDLGRRR
ncbi:MAG: hypothetical protein UX31_C0034G0001 [Candidatus Nomurabacteria bacterium GW2011_GWA1_46_11]|uniref:Uncharacterized protein n=1 Tax=Candidatus Nomurabacteria bacterium GW2011_GWA1_46_11 TaxID=1618732 RepID=A0A0G1NJI6_9BACT|nr:MAG: hypothetical protein UW69_C0033G0001 [Microgenomates group bacterium GW2011_GWA2_44_7]KKT77011.1 MAG: hypothetical protein UW73_C0030G0007 [Microgenomates group bacterium GW2011_GWB1_44_8]KKU20611.1 MAG: hypothetical protein UX31_C0034G0001 [Candidatus Nomurabacteria bacterium GW2011_GWA1_46_11]